MRHCILFAAVLCGLLASCSSKETSALTNIGELQSSIIRLVKAGPCFSNDTESLWAFGVADSLAKTMTLRHDEEAKDLAAAYKALSYVAYGLNYPVFPIMQALGDPDYLSKATECLVDKDVEISTFGKDLHWLELMSDQGFALLFENLDMDNSELEAEVDEAYQEGGADGFKHFLLQNRAFFFAYSMANLHVTNIDDVDSVEEKLSEIANRLDSLPKEVSTEAEYYETFNTIIGARVELIDLLATNIERNKINWPEEE